MSEQTISPLNIKSWAEEDRPREKLISKGRSALTDAELLGILIGSGIRNMTAVDLAKLILQSVGNDLNNLAKLSIKDLSKFKGIGEAKAINIVAALELGRRRKESEIVKTPKLNASKLIYDFMKPYLLDLQHEEFWILILSQASELIKAEKISSGGVTGTIADPRIIFKLALENVGTGIILVHNHPSGNLKPSQQDINLTRKLLEAGKLLDISVHDHIIFGNNGYFSFVDNGLI
ncbi:MAG: DNA repair protein RadC [Bacteroidota bacterium]